MCQETAVSVTRAVTSWRRASRAIALKGLPGEGSAVKKPLLLPACCQWTAVGTAVSGVLSTNVAQTVTARNRTPTESIILNYTWKLQAIHGERLILTSAVQSLPCHPWWG